jgi:hypothetical protein
MLGSMKTSTQTQTVRDYPNEPTVYCHKIDRWGTLYLNLGDGWALIRFPKSKQLAPRKDWEIRDKPE